MDKIADRYDLKNAVNKVIKLTDVQYLIVTLSEKGIAVFEKNEKDRYSPVRAKEIYDVTGAGDTVIAT